MREGLPTTNTGNLHVAVFHTEPSAEGGVEEVAYIANAAGNGEGGARNAYMRQYARVSLSQLYNMQPRRGVQTASFQS